MISLPMRLKKCLDKLSGHYRSAVAEQVQFSQPQEIWQPQWDKRSTSLELAERAHQEAKPLMAQWRQESHRYPVMVQNQMKKYTDAVLSLLKVLGEQNQVLFRMLSIAKDGVKGKLQNLKKSSRAISCYAAQR